MRFSVVLATRDRPGPFKQALASVLGQTLTDREVIVVNDGSGDEHCTAYRSIEVEAEAGEAVRFFHLEPRPSGHGQSYALNFGAERARGDYLCFLDDDDCWSDPSYLERVAAVIDAGPRPLDLHFADQEAYRDGRPQPGPIWLEGLEDILSTQGRAPEAAGAYRVGVADLLRSRGFCHLNTTIVRRSLFQQLGGLDESIRYECDRDFYLRAIDSMREIYYSPVTVSRHNIPDPKAGTAMSTVVSDFEKYLFRLRVLDKAILFAEHEAIRAYAKTHKVYTLKHIAERLAHDGRPRDALFYAREALLAGFTWKWCGFTVLTALKALGRGSR
jgi:glycosyltransferase involved in cell wall biosynthesis